VYPNERAALVSFHDTEGDDCAYSDSRSYAVGVHLGDNIVVMLYGLLVNRSMAEGEEAWPREAGTECWNTVSHRAIPRIEQSPITYQALLDP
jgi:hypothetical protein